MKWAKIVHRTYTMILQMKFKATNIFIFSTTSFEEEEMGGGELGNDRPLGIILLEFRQRSFRRGAAKDENCPLKTTQMTRFDVFSHVNKI